MTGQSVFTDAIDRYSRCAYGNYKCSVRRVAETSRTPARENHGLRDPSLLGVLPPLSPADADREPEPQGWSSHIGKGREANVTRYANLPHLDSFSDPANWSSRKAPILDLVILRRYIA